MMFTAKFDSVAATALQDLFQLLAGATHIVVVHGFELLQVTDFGDAEEEILLLETVRGIGTVTDGSGGTTLTAQPVEDSFAANATVVEANNTTRMAVGTGSLEELEAFGWNVRIPLEKIWTPETRPVIAPSERWTLAMVANPVDSITIAGKILFEEIG
jgi:hypothetical protein